jgi:nickel/cobalt exporter
METIFDLQRWLYAGTLEALKGLNSAGLAGLPALIGMAFSFGMLHALLPGHGKAVLASYYAGAGRFWGALLSTTVLILTHVGSAVLLVLGGFMILQRTIGGAGRAPALEQASQILIVLIGLYLVWRALRPHSHDHDRSGPMLGFVTGLVPCPLTTFIMAYAAANGLIAAGLVLAATFATGMIVTVALAPILAVGLRTWLLPLAPWNDRWRDRIAHGLEIGAAAMVVAIGALPLLRL